MVHGRCFRYFILFLMLALGLFPAGCSKEAWLKMGGARNQDSRWALSLKPGDSYSQRISLENKLHVFIRDAITDKTEMILHHHVIDVDPQGLATVEITVGPIKASMKSMMIQFSYDSEKPSPEKPSSKPLKGRAAQRKRFRQAFEQFRGSKYYARLDNRGRVLELFDIDPPIGKVMSGYMVDKEFGGFQVSQLLCETNLREYAGISMFEGLDAEQPEPNQTWIGYVPLETSRAAAVMGRRTFTFKGVEQQDERRIALVEHETTIDQDKALPKYARTKLKKTNFDMQILKLTRGRGRAKFRLDKGQLLRFREFLYAEIGLAGAKGPNKKTKSKKARKNYYAQEKIIEYIDN